MSEITYSEDLFSQQWRTMDGFFPLRCMSCKSCRCGGMGSSTRWACSSTAPDPHMCNTCLGKKLYNRGRIEEEGALQWFSAMYHMFAFSS